MSEAGERREQSQEFELDLSKIGLLIIVPVGLWAYYTTFRGMVLLTRGETTNQFESIFGTIGAFIGAAAILILLSLTSWILGSDLAASFSNQRRPDSSTRRSLVLMISAFVFFFALSVFFSYTYYHDRYFHLTSEQHVALNQPAQINNRFMEPLRDTLKKNDVVESEKIRDSDKAWSASLSELIRLAGESRDSIRQAVDELRKRTAKEQADLRGKAKEADRQLKKNRDRRAELQIEINRLNQVMKPNLDQIEQLRTEEADANRLAAEATQGLDETKKAACGPICRKWQAEANRIRGQIKKNEAVVAPRRKELARAEAEARKLDDEVAGLQKIINEEKGIDPAAGSGDVSSSTLDLILQALRNAHDFPTWTSINSARPRCEQLVERIRAAKISTKISQDFNCLPTIQAAHTLLDAREKVMTARNLFDKECSEAMLRNQVADIVRQLESGKIKPAQSVPETRRIVENCISLAVPAGLTGAQEGNLLRDMGDFARRNPLAVNVFDRARDALFVNFDGDARLALAVAFAQDMLILVFRFVAENYRYRSRRRRAVELGRPIDVSDNPDDDPQIRAWKALLRLARPGESDTSRVAEADIVAQGFDPDVLANLHATLNNIGIQGAAWSERRGIIVIENSAVRAIDRELRAIEGQRPAYSDPQPYSVERPYEDRPRTQTQNTDGHRRPAPVASTQHSQTSQTGTELRPPSRSARRGRLRELITGAHEPQTERPRPRRPEPVPPPRLRPAQATQKPADGEPIEPLTQDADSPEPPPSNKVPPPAETTQAQAAPTRRPSAQPQTSQTQTDNAFDSLRRLNLPTKE